MNSQQLNTSFASQEQAYYDSYVATVKSAYQLLKATFDNELPNRSDCQDDKTTGNKED